jgi:class 3 adenylate cyclase
MAGQAAAYDELRARRCLWPPLRLTRVCREHVSVFVASPVTSLSFFLRARYGPFALDVAQRIPSARALHVSGSDRWGIFLSPELPDEVERFVAGEPGPEVPDTVLSTLLITDIVRSTERAAALGDRGWRELLERHYALVRREFARFRGVERDIAGRRLLRDLRRTRARNPLCPRRRRERTRIGLRGPRRCATGECELHEEKVAGIAVSIAARVAAQAGAGEVLVSQTVKGLVAGSGIQFEERGERKLKGVPGAWRLYAVSTVPRLAP